MKKLHLLKIDFDKHDRLEYSAVIARAAVKGLSTCNGVVAGSSPARDLRETVAQLVERVNSL